MKLILNGISKSYGGREVLRNVDFRADGPGIYVIEGGSGSGKSTLLRIAAGLEEPDRGTVLREGTLGMVFQEPRLFPGISLLDNVLAPVSARERAAATELLSRLGLGGEEHKKASKASGGMQQRAAFARAIVGNPEILLMDEPLSAQDAGTAKIMTDMMRELAERCAVILATHGESGYPEPRIKIVLP